MPTKDAQVEVMVKGMVYSTYYDGGLIGRVG